MAGKKNKTSLEAENFLDSAIKYAIYFVIFLLPVLYIPNISGDFDFSKQMLLFLGVFFVGFLWLVKILVSKKISIKPNIIHVAVLSLPVVLFFSMIFSKNQHASFWGWPGVTKDGFLTVLCLSIFYFITANVFSKKEIKKIVYVLLISLAVVLAIGVLQLLNWLVFPNGYLSFFSLNTIGSAWGLAFLSAFLIPFLIILFIDEAKKERLFLAVEIFLSAIILLMVRCQASLWVLFFGCLFVVLILFLKNKVFDQRWLTLPMFFSALALFLIIFGQQIAFIPHKYEEISLSQGQSLNIALKSLKENPVLGSGPGTFSYDFLKNKEKDSSNVSSENVSFVMAGSKFLTDLATTGLLGVICFLFIFDTVILFLVKDIFEKKGQFLAVSLFAFFVAQTLTVFLYGSNLSLDFIYFLTIALISILSSAKVKDYDFSEIAFKRVLVTFGFLIIIVFGLYFLFLSCKRYLGEANYYKGLVAVSDKNYAPGIAFFEKAANYNPNCDLYFRQLALTYVFELQENLKEIDYEQASDQQKLEIEKLVGNSINSAKRATDIAENNVTNWLARGYVYRNVDGLFDGAKDWAKTCYEKAKSLDPQNSEIQSVLESF